MSALPGREQKLERGRMWVWAATALITLAALAANPAAGQGANSIDALSVSKASSGRMLPVVIWM